jgi:hypothetical protein
MSVKMTKQRIFIIENNIQKVGQSFFHLSRRTTVIKDLLSEHIFDPYLFSDLIKRQLALSNHNEKERNLFIVFPSPM